MSAFTIAFQVPNLVRSLFADAAIQAAFVPVFTEQLEHGRAARGVPARLDPDLHGRRWSSALITALFILARAGADAAVRARLRRASSSTSRSSLSRLLFPILVLLGVSGMVVGVLNSYDRFGVFAIAPLLLERRDHRRARRPRARRSPRRTRSTPTRSASSSAPSSSSRSSPTTCATRRSGSAARCRAVRPCAALATSTCAASCC